MNLPTIYLLRHGQTQWNLEGRTKGYCQTVYKAIFEAREADKFHYVLEGGESYAKVYERLLPWLSSVKNEKVIVVVADEMINRALRGIYASMDKEKMLTLRQSNETLIKLENGREEILE